MVWTPQTPDRPLSSITQRAIIAMNLDPKEWPLQSLDNYQTRTRTQSPLFKQLRRDKLPPKMESEGDCVGCHRVTQSGDPSPGMRIPSPGMRIPDPIVGSGRHGRLSTQVARACKTGQEPLGVQGRHLDIILD